MEDKLFRETESGKQKFQFDEKVANVFDDMLKRSVPFYVEQQAMLRELAKSLMQQGTSVYDLGCSLATTLMNFAEEIGPKTDKLIGYDNSPPMLEKARKEIKARGLESLVELRYGDLEEGVKIENAGLVTLLWSLQFVRPIKRDSLIKNIYEGLVDGGALIVTEKVLTNNTHMNRLFIDLYYDYKKKQGYSDEEIARKREALENVLIPYRIDENMELFRRNGFKTCETFFQYYNFVGFLCIKQP